MIADLMLQAHALIQHRPMEEQQQRLTVVQEALCWLGTPYHHMGRVIGAGVDCGMLLAEVYAEAGLVPRIEPEAYPLDWALHRGEERYKATVEGYARPLQGDPLPGDLVLYKFGRCISHGAIVIIWPMVLHAYVGRGVVLDDATAHLKLAPRQAGFWTLWGEA